MRVELNQQIAKLQAQVTAAESKAPFNSRADLLHQLGTLLAMAGRNDEALVTTQEALAVVKGACLDGSPIDSQLHLDMADRVFAARRYDEAVPLYHTAVGRLERTHGISSKIYWSARERFGLSAGAIGNYQLARYEVFEVCGHREKQDNNNPENARDLISIYLSIARLESVAGRLDRLAISIRKAHDIALSPLGDDSLMANVFHEMGKMHAGQDDLDNGLDYLEAAYRMRCSCLGSKHPTTLLSKLGVAALLMDLGRLEEARASLLLVRNNAAHDPYNPVNWDSCMAELLLRKGKPQTALRYYTRTLEHADLLSHAQRVTLGNGAVLAAIGAGDFDAAVKYAHTAFNIAVKCWENVLNHGSELDRMGWITTSNVVPMCAAVATNDSTPLTRCILLFKAAVGESVAEDHRFIANSELGREIERTRKALRKIELKAIPLKEKRYPIRTKLDHLDGMMDVARAQAQTEFDQKWSPVRTKLDQLEGMMAKVRARTRPVFNETSIEDLSLAVGDNRVLVEYLCFDRQDIEHRNEEWLGALVISKDQSPTWVELGPTGGPSGVFYKLVLFLPLLQSRTLPSDAEFCEAGLALKNAVWDPVAKMFGDAVEEVVISPDSILQHLSFAALWSGSGFLGEKIRFRYVTSGRRLLIPSPGEPKLGTGVIVASPDFDCNSIADRATDSAIRLSSRVNDLLRLRGDEGLPEAFSSLTGTRVEADRLAKLWRISGINEVRIFQGRAANKSNVMRIKRPQLLHIATHGQFQFIDGATAMNQLLAPFLALSGANRSLARIRDGKDPSTGDDGLLRADEIRSLDLVGTHLVVLSACESGVGVSLPLVGTYSFRRAFQEAGVRHLLLTLWPVSDLQTAGFMPEFYRLILSGHDPVRALHEVQATALESSRHANGPALAARLYGGFVMSA